MAEEQFKVKRVVVYQVVNKDDENEIHFQGEEDRAKQVAADMNRGIHEREAGAEALRSQTLEINDDASSEDRS